MKKHKGFIIAGVVLAALAAFCLWYSFVPKSWADIIGTDQTDSFSFSGSVLYDVSEEVKEYGSYLGQVVTGGITSRLEGCRSYQTETDLFQQVFDILREYGAAG